MSHSSKNFLLLAILLCSKLYAMQSASNPLPEIPSSDYSFEQTVFTPSKERSQSVTRMVEYVRIIENNAVKIHVGQIAFAFVAETKRGIISRLKVEKEHHDKGCGSRLLDDACKKLQEMGATRICLTAISEELEDQKKLIAFYTHRGFKADENGRTGIRFSLSMYKEVPQP